MAAGWCGSTRYVFKHLPALKVFIYIRGVIAHGKNIKDYCYKYLSFKLCQTGENLFRNLHLAQQD